MFDGRGGNGQRKVSQEVRSGIVAIHKGTPQDHGFLRTNWTLEQLARVIAEKLHASLSRGHVGKVVKELGVRWGRCRPVVCCPGRLRALWLAYPWARVIHVILDNYVIHKTQLVRDLLQQMGGRIRLHFLPPYCSNENRIERLWQDLHANVTRNHRCRTMRALLANVLDWLEARFSTEQEYALAV